MDVRVAWTPSVSTDVVVQKLDWLVNGEVVRSVNLKPNVSERLASTDGVAFAEGDVVEVSIVVNDGKSDSVPAVAKIEIPLDPPQSVTNLIIELVVDPVLHSK